MDCPICGSSQCFVRNCVHTNEYTIRRQRKCSDCGYIFHAYERIVSEDLERAEKYRKMLSEVTRHD